MKQFIDSDTVCIPYDKIYVAIRGGEIICINGNILVEPEEEVVNTFLEVPDNAKVKSKQLGRVVHAGKPNRQYRAYVINFGIKSGDDPVKPGDRILFNWNDAIPIQPNAELRGEISRGMLYRMQHKDVHALVPDISIIEA